MSETARTPRSRFYDGGLYARLVDPLVGGLHEIVAQTVAPDERVVDVGCGTGALALRLSERAREVLGVELSPAMASYCQSRLGDPALSHVTVVVGDARHVLSDRPDGYFDTATLVLALHEMPPELRAPLLVEITRVATRALILDYRVPMPHNLPGIRNRLVELLAGLEHFAAFRDFTRSGGVSGVATVAGVSCVSLRHVDHGTFDLCELRRL